MTAADAGVPDATATVDVTVVVAVYNTMPYLTRCLDSLTGQSIGAARMEVVAVDDGSTDGSGAELDRYAAQHPDVFRVLRQPNSGGPAGPSNRALDHARGRYVFFLGADDYLGAEALERMVDVADAHESDVVYVNMVGVGGRPVPRKVFDRTRYDVPLDDWHLAWALSNTKLFRRSLVEEHGLRFREDVTVLSDEPFTLEALFRARRRTILADYDYYYAVRRDDESNITSKPPGLGWLGGLTAALEVVGRFTRPGDRSRANLAARHFHWEAERILARGFLDLEESVQAEILAGLHALAAEFFDDEIRDRLQVRRRVRMLHVRDKDLAGLRAAIACEDERGRFPVTVREGRVFAAYPALDEPGRGWPDRVFDITAATVKRVAAQELEISRVAVGRGGGRRRCEVTLHAHSSLTDLDHLAAQGVAGLSVPGADAAAGAAARVRCTPVADGTEIVATVPFDPARASRSLPLPLHVGVASAERTARLADDARLPPPRRVWYRGRAYLVAFGQGEDGAPLVTARRIRLGPGLARRLKRLRRPARGPRTA